MLAFDRSLWHKLICTIIMDKTRLPSYGRKKFVINPATLAGLPVSRPDCRPPDRLSMIIIMYAQYCNSTADRGSVKKEPTFSLSHHHTRSIEIIIHQWLNEWLAGRQQYPFFGLQHLSSYICKIQLNCAFLLVPHKKCYKKSQFFLFNYLSLPSLRGSTSQPQVPTKRNNWISHGPMSPALLLIIGLGP